MEAHSFSSRPIKAPARRGWMMLAIPLVAVGLALGASQAQAFGPGGPHGGQAAMQERMDRLLTKVNATDAQKSQIKAIWEGLRPQLKTLNEQHFQIRRQIAQAVAAPTINTGDIEKLRQQSVQVIDKISSLMTQGTVNSSQVLTPTQRAEALAEIQKHHRHAGGPGEEDAGSP
jgi:periplasmic protein CpxP/Spy